MSLIIPANSASAAGGFNVANSARFDGAFGAYHLVRSKGASETSLTKGTFSLWVKRTSIDGTQHMLYSNTVADTNNRGYFSWRADEKLRILTSTNNSSQLVLYSTQLFRDPSAWYHIVYSIDTTQSTAANRCILYINGTRVTAFDTATYMDQNSECDIFEGGQTNKEYIGGITGGTSNLHSYLSEYVYIDGLALAADQFGEFDEDSGIWKPIDVSGLTFGTNGYYLDFEDSSALGNDVSGNDNDFTTVNLAANDQSTDTCTNNFATFNPLDKTGTGAPTGSEGNLKLTGDASTNNTWNSTIGLSAGKWYVEMKVLQSTPDTSIVFRAQTNTSGSHNNSYGFDTNPDKKIINGSSSGSAIGSTSQNDILGMALDLDNGKMFIHRNGTYLSSGNPSTGANPFIVTADGMPTEGVIGGHIYNGAVEWNFGSPSYSESGGETDGNGYGNFAHAVPSGYYSLNTKNLAEYG